MFYLVINFITNEKLSFPVKPRIDRTNLNPVTVKAGLPVSLDIKVFGEPPATVTWFFKDQELKPADNLEIINVDYNTKFLMTKSKRASSGRYVIKAKNEVGEDEAEVEITILGKFNKVLVIFINYTQFSWFGVL